MPPWAVLLPPLHDEDFSRSTRHAGLAEHQ
jgi:hypothetical protein